MIVFITGTAGFIGYHLAQRLLERGDTVIGFDNINDYYDVNLKYARLETMGIARDKIGYGKPVRSTTMHNYTFIKGNLEDLELLKSIFAKEHIERVCNLAAQAGVRYSLENPHAYVNSNIVGFVNILECCRHHQIEHLAYASSSSVYGMNEKMPFSTSDNVDHPISLYAASKKSNELMAHTYSQLFQLPTTGLRFFTVYGPWGRPDMALFLFTKAIMEGQPIDVFNNGEMKRDFTYIDDIVEGVVRVIDHAPKGNPAWNGEKPDPSCSVAPYKVYNIGNSAPVQLMDFIKAIEKALGTTAQKNMLPMQKGDVPATWANVDDLIRDLDYQPQTPVDLGVANFIEWYKQFYS